MIFYIKVLACLACLFILPVSVFAQIQLSEIMYDPEGTDTGREWIEILNIGTGDVDLSTYKLLENNINHGLKNFIEGENLTLSNNQYAIIADNPEKFKIDFPDYSGLLIDSAFSLNNTGEGLVLIDGAGNLIDNFTYSVDLGGKNNGNSLQRNDLGFWIEAKPTVGLKNKQQAEVVVEDSGASGSDTSNTGENSSNSNNSSNSEASTHSGQNEVTNYVEKIDLEIGAGRNRFVSINSPVKFSANYNTDKKPKCMWSMGDGGQYIGCDIEYDYTFPGSYNVVLNALLGGVQSTARTKITVSESVVEILSITTGKTVDVMLKNLDDREVNLGGFVINFGKNKHTIARDTILDAGSSVVIPNKITNFVLDSNFSPARLDYPNGKFLSEEKLNMESLSKILLEIL